MFGRERLKINSEVKRDKGLEVKTLTEAKGNAQDSETTVKKIPEQIQQIGGIIRYDSSKSGYYVEQPNRKFVFQTEPDKTQLAQFGKFISVEADTNFSRCSEDEMNEYKRQGYSGIIY